MHSQRFSVPFKNKILSSTSGFSLVEAILAMAILSIGMLGVGLMMNRSMESDRYNNRARFVQQAAMAKIEEIKSQGAETFSPQNATEKYTPGSGTGTGWILPGNTGYDPDSWASRQWQITADSTSGMRKIEVIVSWDKYKFTQVSYGK
jgi:prepilin-type N-terminal cleavage/methylation domain-containing protein